MKMLHLHNTGYLVRFINSTYVLFALANDKPSSALLGYTRLGTISKSLGAGCKLIGSTVSRSVNVVGFRVQDVWDVSGRDPVRFPHQHI